MYPKETKYYIRPFGYISNSQSKMLLKNKKALKINGVSFNSIELIKKKGRKISKACYAVDYFFERVIKKNKKLEILAKNLTTKSKNFLNSNKFSKKNKTLIFSILNITPDSFSDGGDNLYLKDSFNNAKKMAEDGADFIDIGGESTRPGSEMVLPADEAIRVLPIIQKLSSKKFKISLDTRNSSTMELGLLSGVNIINDVSALMNDPKSIEIVKKYNVPIILMHMPGTPQTMMKKNKYKNVVLEVYDFLEERIKYCESYGIKRKNIIIDPGIGFGKDFNQNINLGKKEDICSEKTILLICYADNLKIKGEKNTLNIFNSFFKKKLKQNFNCFHFLPFFPSSSDSGFAVKDHNVFDKRFGNWDHIKRLSKDANIMADIVINHASSKGVWFRNFLKNKDPGKDYFFSVDRKFNTKKVIRPRENRFMGEIPDQKVFLPFKGRRK